MLKAIITLGRFKGKKKCYQKIWAKYLPTSSYASPGFLLNYRLSETLLLNLNCGLVAKLPTVAMTDGYMVVCLRDIVWAPEMSSEVGDRKLRGGFYIWITLCSSNNKE